MATEPDSSFESLVAPHQAELRAYCYRMLGSIHDAEDALQDALLGAWRGLGGFEGRGSLRAWLYRCATNACIHVIARRPTRILPVEHAPPFDGLDVEPVVEEPIWLEPFPHDDAAMSYERLESVELAFGARDFSPARPMSFRARPTLTGKETRHHEKNAQR